MTYSNGTSCTAMSILQLRPEPFELSLTKLLHGVDTVGNARLKRISASVKAVQRWSEAAIFRRLIPSPFSSSFLFGTLWSFVVIQTLQKK